MRKLFVVGVEKKVDFFDVLANKWVGTLQYQDVDLMDRVLPSFSFHNEALIARAMAFKMLIGFKLSHNLLGLPPLIMLVSMGP